MCVVPYPTVTIVNKSMIVEINVRPSKYEIFAVFGFSLVVGLGLNINIFG